MAMKITIEQLDIEQAIKDHIGSMMEIKEGAQLEIDLSATRGSAGFTATITIRNADEAARKPVTAEASVDTTQTATMTKPAKVAKVLNIPKTNEKPEEEAAPIEETPVEDTASVAQTEEQAEVSSVTNEAAPADEAEQPAEPTEAAPRASLFSGLNKPKN